MSFSKRAVERIQGGLKQFVPILQTQRDRDVSEADTVTVVKDLLSEVFGYDKYAELTSEHAIRGTFCDLAVKFDGKLRLLLEVKAIGAALQERHVKQAIDYATNQGVEWVVLTNGIDWVLFHVLFQKPIDKEEVVRVNLLEVNPKDDADIEKLYLFTREGISKDALMEYRDRQDASSRFMLAAIIMNSDAVLAAIRKEVRRCSDILVDKGLIEKVLREQVVKRDVLEGRQADTAVRRFQRKRETSRSQRDVPGLSQAPGDRLIADKASCSEQGAAEVDG
jgi:predicted type IV restriction endonuclease